MLMSHSKKQNILTTWDKLALKISKVHEKILFGMYPPSSISPNQFQAIERVLQTPTIDSVLLTIFKYVITAFDIWKSLAVAFKSNSLVHVKY